MSKIIVEYSTNNSGGSYWLKEKDWAALKDAGWKLFGFGDFAYKDGHCIPDKDGLPSYKWEVPDSEQDKDKYDLSILSKLTDYHDAYKKFSSIDEAITEFEKLTGQDVSEEGCNCCGPPHSFTWGKDIVVRVDVDKQDYNHASGDNLLEYIFPDKNTSLSKRELLDKS